MLQGYGPSLLQGLLNTLQLSFLSLIIGSTIGMMGASCKLSKYRWLKAVAALYTLTIRGIPELLLLLITYFGGTALLSQLMGDYYEVNAFSAGVFCLSIIFGGYATEVFRGSFESVSRGEIEAAQAFGLSPWHLFYRIQLPLALRHAIPGMSNLWLVLLKDSALVSVIGMEDLMRKTELAVGATRQPFTFYFTAALIYLMLTYLSQKFLKYMERRTHRGFESKTLQDTHA